MPICPVCGGKVNMLGEAHKDNMGFYLAVPPNPDIELRNKFAAFALAGMHARDSFDEGQATPQQRAALAFIDADAMLAESKKERT